MKNLLFLFIFLILSNFYVCSQDKGYIAISLGPSFPAADFASKDMNNTAAGFASIGAVFDISFGYKIGKYFGVSAILHGQANKVNAQAIADEMSRKYTGNISGAVRSGSWGSGGLLTGGYGSFPFSKQLSFESRLMIGFISATSPDITINMASLYGSGWAKQSSAVGVGFAYLTGIGIKYNVGKKVCMLANIDYLGANIGFDNVEVTNSMGMLQNTSFTQIFGAVNMGFGVGYRF